MAKKYKLKNWMIKSYNKDGAKEVPIPKWALEKIKAQRKEAKAEKTSRKGLLDAD